MSGHDQGDWDASTRREALAYADALHSLARYLTGADTDAEDLVQETYARAFTAERRFEAGTNLKAWLFRILRNTFVDQYRRLRDGPIDAGAAVPEDLSGAARASELERLGGVAPRDLEAAMMALSEDGRTVILLDLEGLTEAETAAVLGCAVGTVKSRLARARALLRRLLADYREGA
jgi:RNA polymerase sigma-70 factor (ECF subfamily)